MVTRGYRPIEAGTWAGRVDDPKDREAFRWHQVVECVDLDAGAALRVDGGQAFCLLGFCSDEGVRRNLGRAGAALAPACIRRELANLPVDFPEAVRIFDAGDVWPVDGNLVEAQAELAERVCRILESGAFPILLGGGHEIALGHETALRRHLAKRGEDASRLGIVNFDAHLDLRPAPVDGSSGTMFRQIADLRRAEGLAFPYCCVGLQRTANTRRLLKTAEELGVVCLFGREIAADGLQAAGESLDSFAAGVDSLYLSVCADVFSSAFAPGVSATQPFGLEPEIVLALLKRVLRTGKVRGFDIAEVSPRFDEGSQTAKLAAIVVFAVVGELVRLWERK